MHSLNVVLRNLQEMIKSDKWGPGFLQDRLSCDIHYIINGKNGLFRARGGSSLSNLCKLLPHFCMSLKQAERILSLKPLSLKPLADNNKSSMMNVSLSEKIS